MHGHYMPGRYRAPDRRPNVGKPISLEYECSCGAPVSMGQGRYHSLDGIKPIAFTTNDWDGKVEPETPSSDTGGSND